MKIVIDIDEYLYKTIKTLGLVVEDGDAVAVSEAIANGIPLPEHHGDLKDTDEIIEKIRKLPSAGIRRFINAESVFKTILDAPTIIEAEER